MAEPEGSVEDAAFVKAVRAGKVKTPDLPGFDRAVWTATYEASSPTPADQALHEAGLAVDTHLTAIRARLAKLGGLPVGGGDGVRVLVGFVNHAVAVVTRKLSRRIDASSEAGSPFVFPSDWRRIFQDVTGTQVGAEQIIESVVDGTEFPIRFALTGRLASGSHVAPEDGPAVYGLVHAMSLLGQLYGRMSTLWRSCIAGRVGVVVADGGVVYDETDEGGRRRALAMARREALLVEASLRSSRLDSPSVTMVGGRVPKGVEATGTGRARQVRSVRVKPGKRSGGMSEIYRMLQGRVVHPDTHLEDLLPLPLPAYGGLSANGLLRVWDAIQVMATRLIDALPSSAAVRDVGDLEGFAPSVSVQSLERALRQATGLPPKHVRAAIGALTFTGERGQTLWFRPLVRVSEDELAPVLTALASPNMHWVTEHWLQEGGVDLEKRGALFESEVRSDVAHAIKTGPIHDAECHPQSIHLQGRSTSGRRSEEIDLLVRVGQHVLVGEVKCRLLPTGDPNGWSSLMKTIRHGSVQAARKAEFVAANREALLAATGWSAPALGDPISTIPVVVVNLPDGAGLRETEVPVVDASILVRYFSMGYLRTSVEMRAAGVAAGGVIVPFYQDASQAAENLSAYLLDPPQLAVYAPSLRVVEHPILIPDLTQTVIDRYYVAG